jgi:hypothetical protein
MYHESYKVQAMFFFRFCDVANIMIIHKLITQIWLLKIQKFKHAYIFLSTHLNHV